MANTKWPGRSLEAETDRFIISPDGENIEPEPLGPKAGEEISEQLISDEAWERIRRQRRRDEGGE